MHRCDQMRQFLLSHREEILADTLFLARHQSPSSNKALTEQCAQAIQTLMRSRLQAEPEAIFPQESFGPHLSYRIGQGRPIALMLVTMTPSGIRTPCPWCRKATFCAARACMT